MNAGLIYFPYVSRFSKARDRVCIVGCRCHAERSWGGGRRRVKTARKGKLKVSCLHKSSLTLIHLIPVDASKPFAFHFQVPSLVNFALVVTSELGQQGGYLSRNEGRPAGREA